MTTINLKFSPDMEQAIFDGRKCCTTRDEPKGKEGDFFLLRGVLFRIIYIKVTYCTLKTIDFYYRLEGFDTEVEFFSRLYELYPNRVTFYVHFFARVGGE